MLQDNHLFGSIGKLIFNQGVFKPLRLNLSA